MLKISPLASGHQAITFRLEGRLAGPWVVEVRQVCEQNLAQGRTVKLNLADVSFTDPDGVLLLSRLKSKGVALEEYSLFLAEQLRTAAVL